MKRSRCGDATIVDCNMAFKFNRENSEGFLSLFLRCVTPTISLFHIVSFVILGFAFVIASAALISIILFQTRIIEARNQSKTFSLTSLIQSVRMQQELESSLDIVQKGAPIVSRYEEVQISYSSQISQFSEVICKLNTATEDRSRCMVGIGGALNTGAPTAVYVHRVLENYTNTSLDKFPEVLRNAVRETVELASARTEFTRANNLALGNIRSACLVIMTSIGSVPIESIEKSSVLSSFSSEYVRAARMRCMAHYGFGFGVVAGPATQKSDTQLVGTGAGSNNNSATPNLGGKRETLEGDLTWTLFFDLVSYFRFYQKFLGADADLIVIAPIEISFIGLVIVCGALGAMLRISIEKYNPTIFAREWTEQQKANWPYYLVIGIMCALIVYILAKTAFAGITEKGNGFGSGNLSPFVTAFLAIVSGLMCEEACQQIIIAGKAVLTRAGSGAGKKLVRKVASNKLTK